MTNLYLHVGLFLGLERATEYTIAVKAKNDHGPASSSPVPIKAKTLCKYTL